MRVSSKKKPPRSAGRRVGALTHSRPDLKAPFFAETLRGLRAGLSGRGIELVINPKTWDVDGVCALAPERAEKRLLAGLLRRGLPAVVLCGAHPGCPSVDTDNMSAAEGAVGQLLAAGHRRVVMLNGKLDTANGRDRYLGYRRALRRRKVAFNSDLVVEGRFDRALGRSAMEKLLGRRVPFSAVFAANDHMALGAMEALRRAGLRVPRDAAVVGFDDIPEAAAARPPLTTVAQPFFEIGEKGGQALADLFAGKKIPRQFSLRARWIERGSA